MTKNISRNIVTPKNARVIVPVVFILVQLLFGYSLISQTTINGGTVNGTWTSSGSPYLINGNISIAYGNTLDIQPGVVVKFQGHFNLSVSGCLRAIGNFSNPVHFTPTNVSTGWHGVRFKNIASIHDSSILKYCDFIYGNAAGTGDDLNGGAIFIKNAAKINISNCSISNNTATQGGGIYCISGSAVIAGNTITLNSAGQGGGIYCASSSPVISNNVISANTATLIGGGGILISGASSNPTITMNDINNNSVTGGSGGGICAEGAHVVLLNNTIFKNTSTINGGGITISNGIISNNVISSNSVMGTGILNGGGVFTNHCFSLTVTNNIICNNTSEVGGGIYLASSITEAKLYNNLIVNNESTNSTYGGGGIYCFDSDPLIVNTTVVNNKAASSGGALFCSVSSRPVFHNCILYGNVAYVSGQQVYLLDQASSPDFYFNDLQGGTSAIAGNPYTGTHQNNIDLDPNFVSPSTGNGANYSGSSADWHLNPGSPCINVGNSSGPFFTPDIGGLPRVMGITIDMGAYEFADQITIGLLKPENKNKLRVYPNPFFSYTHFELQAISKELILDIYNINGEKIRTVSYYDSKELIFNRNGLGSGVYSFILKTDSHENISGKFIITD